MQFKRTAVRTIIASRNLALAAGQPKMPSLAQQLGLRDRPLLPARLPHERLSGLNPSENGSPLFGAWHRQTDIGHCSPWWIRHFVRLRAQRECAAEFWLPSTYSSNSHRVAGKEISAVTVPGLAS